MYMLENRMSVTFESVILLFKLNMRAHVRRQRCRSVGRRLSFNNCSVFTKEFFFNFRLYETRTGFIIKKQNKSKQKLLLLRAVKTGYRVLWINNFVVSYRYFRIADWPAIIM